MEGTPKYTVPHYLSVVTCHSAKLAERRVPEKGFNMVLQVEILPVLGPAEVVCGASVSGPGTRKVKAPTKTALWQMKSKML